MIARVSRLLRSLPPAAAVAALLACFLAACLCAGRAASVTFDEFAHVPAGVAYWRHAAFDIYPQNPPLPRLLSALAVLPWAAAPAPKTAALQDPEYRWEYAEDFLLQNAAPPGAAGPGARPRPFLSYERIIDLARLPIIALGLLLGLIVFWWSRALFGPAGALVALALYSFSPTVIAHASLATTDLAFACGAAGAMFAAWRYTLNPGWQRLLAAAAVFGLALLTKFPALLLAPPAAVLIWTGAPRRRAAHIAAFALTAWAVFCAGYFFTGLLVPVGEFALHSGKLAAVQGALPAWLPCPLPAAAVRGLDAELARGERHLGIFYLLGHLSRTGWLGYFPVCLAVKVPLPVQALWLSGIFLLLRGRRAPARGGRLALLTALLAPPLLLLAAFTAVKTSAYGIRYLLACFPFFFVVAGAVPGACRTRAARGLLIVLLLWHAAGSLAAAPHYLAYFNAAAGGPRGGLRLLADSNLDWGQQLKELRRYLEKTGRGDIALSYCGPLDPRVYGIDWQPLHLGVSRGPAAVSANHLLGYFPLGGVFGGGVQDFSALLKTEPVAVIGGSLYVYELK